MGEAVAYVLGTSRYPSVIGSLRAVEEKDSGYLKIAVDIRLPERGMYRIVLDPSAEKSGEAETPEMNAFFPPLMAGNGKSKIVFYTRDFGIRELLDRRVCIYRNFDSLHEYLFGKEEEPVAEGYFRKISRGRSCYGEECAPKE